MKPDRAETPTHVESARVRPPRLTEPGLQLLELAAEHRHVLPAHAARLLSTSPATARRRLRALRGMGLLESAPLLHGQPMTWRITKPGLRAIGSSLPLPRPPDPGAYRHDVGLAWLYVAARVGAFGPLEEVVSERRMRSIGVGADSRRHPHAVRLGGNHLHFPDLVLRTASGHRVALELELSAKDARRRERILRGYGIDGGVDAVVYLVERASVGEAISRTAGRLGLGDLISVQRVDIRAPGGPPSPSAALARTRAGTTACDGRRAWRPPATVEAR